MDRGAQEIVARILTCERCPLGKQSTQHVPPRGNLVRGVKVLFVGEAPGKVEDRVGLPFVGASGVMLSEWIRFLKLTERDYAIANAVNCIPRDGASVRKPSKGEMEACGLWLQSLLTVLQPMAVVALGRSAQKALDRLGQRHLFQYHPAYYLYTHESWLTDLWELRKKLEGVLANEEGKRKDGARAGA